ncbi:hypothetical protein E8E11_000512 [Didymella keratinophila]|nr:hypothetical protein E8E11_000512 [Didymella keratinophila]
MTRDNPVLQALVEPMPGIQWEQDGTLQFHPTEEADFTQLINGMGLMKFDETSVMVTAQEVRWPTLEERLALIDDEIMAKERGEW